MPDTETLKLKLEDLIQNWEDEVVEFKGKSFSENRKIADYVSALGNEAFLRGIKDGWLILGVNNNYPHLVEGTNFKKNPGELNTFMLTLGQQLNETAHIEKYEMQYKGNRVLLFHIPAATAGHPITSGRICYGREGESLVPLTQDAIDKIRFAMGHHDWSGELIAGATIDDLEPAALRLARRKYIQSKQADTTMAAEISSWSDERFLMSVGLMRTGRLTNAAIILLGKPTALSLTGLSGIEIRWILRDKNDDNIDYDHLHIPFIIAADNAFSAIRNTHYRHMSEGSIFPDTLKRYDDYTLRESINNAIAHADYTKNRSIDIIEVENERVIISNSGTFLPMSLENVLESATPCSQYRNDTLANAMVAFQMIDRIGSGIPRMFRKQLERLFPVPEYDISKNMVRVTITGKSLDVNFAKNLDSRKGANEIALWDIALLYDVYCHHFVSKAGAARLRAKKLVTGRYPQLKLSPKLLSSFTEKGVKEEIISQIDQPVDSYKIQVLNILSPQKGMTTQEIIEMLGRHFPKGMSDNQRKWKMQRILAQLLAEGKILKQGKTKGTRWLRQTA